MKRKLEQSENTIESLIKQAQNFLAQNRLPEALEGFKSVLALDNSNIIANAGYKEVMFREGIQLNKSDSLDDFFSELQREPHPDAAQAYRADRYRQQGDFETALKNYNELLKQDAANLFLRAGRGAMFLEQKRLEEAFNDLNFVLCSDPQHIFALIQRGNAWLLQGKPENALYDFRAALNLDPENNFVQMQHKKILDFFALIHQARLLQEQGKLQEALEVCNSALNLMQSSNALARRSKICLLMGKLPKALLDCNAALKLDPLEVFTLAVAGEVFLQLNMLPEALSYFGRALDLAPEYPLMPRFRELVFQNQAIHGELLGKNGDIQGASLYFNVLLNLYPKNHFALFNRGMLLQQQGRLSEAVIDFDAALNLAPQYFHARECRESIFLNQIEDAESSIGKGHRQEGLRKLNEVLRQNPTNYCALAARGELFRIQGKLPEALEDFKKSLKLNPEDPFALVGCGDVLKKLGQPQAALKYLDQALTKNPKDCLARDIRRLVCSELELAQQPILILEEKSSDELPSQQVNESAHVSHSLAQFGIFEHQQPIHAAKEATKNLCGDDDINSSTLVAILEGP